MNGTQVRWPYKSPGPMVVDALEMFVFEGRTPTAVQGNQRYVVARTSMPGTRVAGRRLIGWLLSTCVSKTEQGNGENQQQPREPARSRIARPAAIIHREVHTQPPCIGMCWQILVRRRDRPSSESFTTAGPPNAGPLIRLRSDPSTRRQAASAARGGKRHRLTSVRPINGERILRPTRPIAGRIWNFITTSRRNGLQTQANAEHKGTRAVRQARPI